MDEVNEIFAREKGVLVLRPGDGCCCSLYFTIPSGCYALVTRHGADEDYEGGSAVWPAGLHFPHMPWVGVSHLVTKQSVVLDLPVKGCKTKDNVTVTIDVALVFRIMGDESKGEDPELVRKFVHQVTPRGLEQQLRDAQEESVRGLARSLKHTEVYGVRSGNHDAKVLDNDDDDDDAIDVAQRDEIFQGSSDAKDKADAKRAAQKGIDITETMRANLNKQFVPQGVLIESVSIKDVRLPDDITKQMFEKTMVISQNAQQTMFHANQLQNNRMEQEIETLKQTFQEEREAEISAGAKIANAEQVKLDDAKAQATKAEAIIREETSAKLQNIRAESGLECQRVLDSMNAALVKIDTEARREAAEAEANANLEVQTLLASSELQKERNIAKSQEVIAKAEGKIAPWIEKKNEFDTKQLRLNVFEKLAENQELIISSSTDEGVNLVAMSDAILQAPDSDDNSRGALMAQLALMGQGTSAFIAPGRPK